MIEVLGVGGCFSTELGNSSIIVWKDDGKGLLIDCGITVFPILKDKGYLSKIDSLFITHRHGDHIGSLDTFLYYKRFVLNQKVNFINYDEHKDYLFAIDPNFQLSGPCIEKTNYQNNNTGCKIYNETHMDDDLPYQSFYYQDIFYSGDTNKALLNQKVAKDAKIILHEVSFNKTPVHTYFDDLVVAEPSIKSKTWLYHYNLGDFEKYNDIVKDAGFAGMLKKGQILRFL